MSQSNSSCKPPKVAEWLLTQVAERQIRESAIGDFEEQFHFRISENGLRQANLWYWWQVIRSMPALIVDSIYWSVTMFKNYLKIIGRNLVRQKASSFINITGLAIGMTCSMLILMWVQHELSYDTFNEKADDIYRVVENQYYAGGEIFPVAVTPSALAKALKEQFPEIIRSTRLSFRSLTIKYDDKIFTEGIAFADPDVLDIFTLPFVKGDPRTALSEPHSIVVSEDAARKYFGDDEPIGKVLKIGDQDFKVAGVMENMPDNAHLRFDLLAPVAYLGELGSNLENWGRNWLFTYVLLKENTPYREVNEKIIDLIQQNNEESNTEIYLQPLTDIHLYSAGKYTADIGGHGDVQYVRIFSAIAIFVLLIACINFMNLATARSEKRSKEVGLRKVVGAHRFQIVKQFLGESLALSALAFSVALLLVNLLLPTFNDLAGKDLALDQLGAAAIFGFLAIALFSGFISGSYPALYLSSVRPVETLKGGKGPPHSGRSLFRKTLVVIQFSLSVFMIIGTLAVSKQIQYIRNKNLGLDKENLGYVWMAGEFRDKHEVAKHELLKNPNITSITVTSQLPTYIASSTSGWDWEGRDPGADVLMHYASVDYDYVETYKMEMAEGRFFSPDFASDSVAAVVNETAVEIMGMGTPVGRRLTIGRNDLTIVGVVKDFHFKPIQTKIEPMVLLIMPNRYNAMVMRIRPEEVSSTISFVEETYRKFNSETPFHFNFLDEDYDSLYRAEHRIGTISKYFAIMAIFISSLGLYALASYIAERRTKEIGIRKVLGASVPAIFVLLSKNFVFLTAIANLIAWPAAYLVMSSWLQNYAYRASLTPPLFVVAALAAVIVVLLTVSYQAVKAALANPARALRYE